MEPNQPSPPAIATPVAIVTGGMLTQMLFQIALQAIVSRQLGTNYAVDAYEAAVAIPLVISSMVTLPLGAILIPLVTRVRERRGEEAAWESASSLVLTLIVFTLALATGVAVYRTEILTSLYKLSSAEVAIASDVLWIVVWLIPANTVIALSQGIYHWRGSFALPAAAGVFGPAVTLAVLILQGPVTVSLLATATIAGAAASTALQLPLLFRRLQWRISPATLRDAARLTGPVLLGAIYWRLDPMIDRSIGSGFDEGTLASLGYCSRVTNAMAALAAGGLSVVAFPRMSAAAGRSSVELARETSRAVGASLLILVPLATAWFMFGDAIVRDLLEGGRFTPADTARVSHFIRCAIGVVIGGSVGEIFARAFYAQHDTLVPVLIGASCMTAGFGLKWGFSRAWGPGGLLIASSLATCASAGIQFIILRRRFGPELRTYLFSQGMTAAIATAAACAAGWAVLQAGVRFPAFCGGAAGLAVYLAGLYLLRRPQPNVAA